MAGYSKFATIPATCADYVHPWTDSCLDAHAGLLVYCFPDSLRIYVTVYLLALAMRGRIPRKADIKRTVAGIFQSAAFLTMAGFSYTWILCMLRRAMGHYNFLTVSFIPSFLSSIISILIERPSRRPLLSLYVANVATETCWRMAAARGMVRPIPHARTLLFGVGTAILLTLFRAGLHRDSESKNDSMFDLLRLVVGPYEEYGRAVAAEQPARPLAGSRSASIANKALHYYRQLVMTLKRSYRHQTCPHPHGCLHYTLSGGSRQFVIGFGLQLALKLLLSARRIPSKPSILRTILTNKDTYALAFFLAGYSSIFRGTSCILRWLRGRDSPWHALPAGLIAAPAFTFYPDTTVALYVVWKMLQVIYMLGVRHEKLPRIADFPVFLYALSTATLFHAAILEPTSLRPSYWKFLHSISGARVAAMSRKPLEVFGLDSERLLQEVMKKTNTKIEWHKICNI